MDAVDGLKVASALALAWASPEPPLDTSTVAWTGDVGDPEPGAAKLDLMFTSHDDAAAFTLDATPRNLTSKVLTLQVRLEADSNDLWAKLVIKSGETYVYAQGPGSSSAREASSEQLAAIQTAERDRLDPCQLSDLHAYRNARGRAARGERELSPLDCPPLQPPRRECSSSPSARHASTLVNTPTTWLFWTITAEPYLFEAISLTTSSRGVSGATA